jgi:hypothetical protein
VGGSSCARIKQSCTSVRSRHSAQTACSMIAARGSGDRPGRARRSNGDNRSGASGQSLTSTSRRSDLREYVSDQPQDAEVGAWSRIFDGSGSPGLLAWSLLGVAAPTTLRARCEGQSHNLSRRERRRKSKRRQDRTAFETTILKHQRHRRVAHSRHHSRCHLRRAHQSSAKRNLTLGT